MKIYIFFYLNVNIYAIYFFIFYYLENFNLTYIYTVFVKTFKYFNKSLYMESVTSTSIIYKYILLYLTPPETNRKAWSQRSYMMPPFWRNVKYFSRSQIGHQTFSFAKIRPFLIIWIQRINLCSVTQ